MTFLDAVRRDGAAIAEFVERDPKQPIPSCPGWVAQDVADHIQEMTNVRLDAGGVVRSAPGLAAAITDLDKLAPDFPDALFRGLAHECAIHLWDVSSAFGEPQAIEGELACDGVDEFFDGALPGQLEWRGIRAGDGQTIHLHRTDGEGEWLIRLEESAIVTHEHAKGDVAVRGTSSDLVLCLWGRIPPPEVFGDASVLEHLRAISQH